MTGSLSHLLGQKAQEGPLGESIQSRVDRILKPDQQVLRGDDGDDGDDDASGVTAT
jgi:hypothetical protein